MAQITFADGDVPTAAQLNTYTTGEGGAWTSWTPTVTQSGSVTVTNTRSRYARWGRKIEVTISLSVTGSGTSSNQITVSLPVTAAASGLFCAGFGSITTRRRRMSIEAVRTSTRRPQSAFLVLGR